MQSILCRKMAYDWSKPRVSQPRNDLKIGLAQRDKSGLRGSDYQLCAGIDEDGIMLRLKM